MEGLIVSKFKNSTCDLPRRAEAIQACFCLVWRKQKKDRPDWLLRELKYYC